MKHCVTCRQKVVPDQPWHLTRCRPCFLSWRKAGGIQRRVTVTEIAGMRIGETTYANHALYCKDCGAPLDKRSRRFQYALSKGREISSCDACHFSRKHA